MIDGINFISLGLFQPAFAVNPDDNGGSSYREWDDWLVAALKTVNLSDRTLRIPCQTDSPRSPQWHVRTGLNDSHQINRQFHFDNSPDRSAYTLPPVSYHDANQWLVAWANVKPTEFQLGDGSIWTPQPWQAVLFNNTLVPHRTPPMTEAEAGQRWFARAYVDTTPRPKPETIFRQPQRDEPWHFHDQINVYRSDRGEYDYLKVSLHRLGEF